jgi:predicted esterase
MNLVPDPHRDQPVLGHGPPPAEARASVILLHGRGDSAAGILSLTAEFDGLDDVAWLAPQAAGHRWYPHSFLVPLERNEPDLSSALRVIDGLVRRLDADGVPADRIVVMGFSQGACLTSEYAARHARRYGGIVVLSGGLIGPSGTPRDYPGTFAGTPALVGCSDVDPHIPLARVEETIATYRRMGARVDDRIYPNLPHTIINDELTAVEALLRAIPPRENSAAFAR